MRFIVPSFFDALGQDPEPYQLVNGWENGEPYAADFSTPIECHCHGWQMWEASRRTS